jgi:putative ABC transport system substrate-binding protein
MNLSKQIGFKRQILLLTLLLAICILLGSCGKRTQQKVYRVGIVSGAEAFADVADGFKAKMTELGYIEGRNIVYDFRKLNADPAGVQRVVKQFIAEKVDLIFAFPTEPAMAAKVATEGTGIPVVFAMAGIEMDNLVESISKPGGRITGVRYPGPESTVKRLEILHELAPDARRVYLIYDPVYPNAHMALGGLRPAASSLGITLVEDPVNSVEELRATLQARDALSDIGIDAILLMPDILNHSPDGFGAILKFANEHKVPIGGGMDFTADLGAIFNFVPDNVVQGMMAAPLADKIFKGTPAGSIMIVTPPSRLRLNYKVIKELGLEVSEGLLSRADEIIR